MSARTVAVLRALAVAGDKGLAHLANQQNTGTWISRCGRQIRGQDIRSWEGEAAGVQAEVLGDRFCATCRDEAIAAAGNVADGVYVLLRLDPADASSAQLLELPLESIAVDAGAHRAVDEDSDAFAQLVQSVLEHGVVQPIVASRSTAGLRLVIGRRRLAAAAAAGLTSIPTLVRDVTKEQSTLDALSENLHRADLNPIEQALAYQRALEQLELSKEALADLLHVSRPRVSNTVRLLGLPAELQALVAAGTLSAAHGRALLRFPSGSEEQAALAQQILNEGMSTHAAEEAARRATTAPAAKLTDLSQLLALALVAAGLLGPKVQVTSTAERARIVLDVDAPDLPRVLAQLEQLQAVEQGLREPSVRS